MEGRSSCLGGETSFPEVQLGFFQACYKGDLESAAQAVAEGADVNFQYVEWRQQVRRYPIKGCPCLYEVEYPRKVWYAGPYKVSKWLWKTYSVNVGNGCEWEPPAGVHPEPKTEDGDTLLFIALKCNRKDLVQWLLTLEDLRVDLGVQNGNGKDLRQICREYHREHLLASRPEIMNPETAATTARV